MARHATLLALVALAELAACDALWGTDYFEPDPPLCGPYGLVSPVDFDPVLDTPTDFSVAADGSHGLVIATYSGVTGATPILIAGDDNVWHPEIGKLGGNVLANAISGGHMGVNGDVFGWIDRAKGAGYSIIVRYAFTTVWGASTPEVARANLVELVSGNEVESPDDGGAGSTRYVVEISQSGDGTTPNKLTILAALPGSNSFLASSFADPLNTVPNLSPTGAVLTGDHEILVYSAMVGTKSHLFETAFSKFQYAEGHLIGSIYDFDKGDDQPWINSDCSQIWFRRDGLTWTAKKL